MISAEQLDALEPQMRQAMLSLVSELQAQLQAKDELMSSISARISTSERCGGSTSFI